MFKIFLSNIPYNSYIFIIRISLINFINLINLIHLIILRLPYNMAKTAGGVLAVSLIGCR